MPLIWFLVLLLTNSFVIKYQMFTKALQGLIAPKGVRIIDRTLTGMVLNMKQKGLPPRPNPPPWYRPCDRAPEGQRRCFCLSHLGLSLTLPSAPILQTFNRVQMRFHNSISGQGLEVLSSNSNYLSISFQSRYP
jgi:hypothetical protein